MTHAERIAEIGKLLDTDELMLQVDAEYLYFRVRVLTEALEKIQGWDTVLEPSWPVTEIASKALEGES